MTFHRRCDYINSDGVQCETWYRAADGEVSGFCPGHSGVVSTDMAAQDTNKSLYIEKRKEQEKICAAMTLDELDEHYAKLETFMEELKMQLLTAGATKRMKLEALSDDERAVRRKIKTPRTSVDENGIVKKNKAAKTKVPSLKDDPIQYMMLKHGFSEEQARKMLGL